MPFQQRFGLPLWSVAGPLLTSALLAGVWGKPLAWYLLVVVGIALISAVLLSVHHAEVVAHRVGEPFGTLILALAVTVIETSLIISMMLSSSGQTATLARDTLYAAVMIVCNGIVGLCLLVGGIRHHVVEFRVEGSSPPLSVLAALTTLTLVLPQFTLSTVGPTYSSTQLAFSGLASLLLYGVFVFVQTVRHRDYFLPLNRDNLDAHAERPSNRTALISLILLLISLTSVVGLAKLTAPSIERGVSAMGAPPAVVGIAIALLVLLPETIAALRAAARNRMQTSLNLALGSALASIGLTVPVVAALAIALNLNLELGLPAKEMVLVLLTLFVSATTLAGGRATVLHGAVHLVLAAAFLFLAIVP